ncbi:hypothetical protein IBTHAUMO2_510011 [Nitrosopumilaceae archaeon]|nr:hypothetical protein IBTHAUMO2_510011 [Nitrosopumilaceae archaeon]
MPRTRAAGGIRPPNQFIRWAGPEARVEEFAICVECGNPLEGCSCVCPYCGERDRCECALFDAATGG